MCGLFDMLLSIIYYYYFFSLLFFFLLFFLAQVPRGLEMVVCQLRVGDHVLLRCASDYNYSPTRRPANVREDDTLFMEVQIIRHEKEKNLHEMTLIDRIQYAKRRRETGNSLFTSGQYRSAQKHYEKALSVLNGLDAPQEQLPEKDKQLVRIHNALNQLNLAMSLIKYGAHDKAIEQCNKVRNGVKIDARTHTLMIRLILLCLQCTDSSTTISLFRVNCGYMGLYPCYL